MLFLAKILDPPLLAMEGHRTSQVNANTGCSATSPLRHQLKMMFDVVANATCELTIKEEEDFQQNFFLFALMFVVLIVVEIA